MKKINLHKAALGACVAFSFVLVALPLTRAEANYPSPQTNNFSFSRNLTLGSSGSDVVQLQANLQTMGFLTMPAGVVKGYFGALTKAAVVKYQIANNISPAAGFVGPLTRARLNGLAIDPTPPADNTWCNAVKYSIFQSVTQHETGPTPTGVSMGYWEIRLQDDKFTWAHSDMIEVGSYTCVNNVVVAKFPYSERPLTGYYNKITRKFIFNGVEYEGLLSPQ